MNVRLVFPRRIARGDRRFGRRQMVDHVWWLRRIWFRRLFNHASGNATWLPLKGFTIDRSGLP
jgi:hypothetical protein